MFISLCLVTAVTAAVCLSEGLPPGVVRRPSGTKLFESSQRQAETSRDRTTDTVNLLGYMRRIQSKLMIHVQGLALKTQI